VDSKKLLVISDTHGSLSTLKVILNWAKNHVPPKDSIYSAVFLGDGIADLRPAIEASGFYSDWKYVRGNNDWEHSVPDSGVFDFEEHRFFICHGHQHSLFDGYHSLVNSGQRNKANVVLFGHTHAPYQKIVNGILLVNPGSAGRPRSRFGSTFAVIECLAGSPIKTTFMEIDSKEKIQEITL